MRNKLAKQLREYVRTKHELEDNSLLLGVEPTEYEFIKHKHTGKIQVVLREDSPRRKYKAFKNHITRFGL